jgi:hypothetical protein
MISYASTSRIQQAGYSVPKTIIIIIDDADD